MDHEESIRYAKKYLEDMLAFFGVNTEVETWYEGSILEITVPSTDINSILIGRNAETLRSLQYTLSTVLRNNNAYTNRENIVKKTNVDKSKTFLDALDKVNLLTPIGPK
jgi:spoIIIJ-associated protein